MLCNLHFEYYVFITLRHAYTGGWHEHWITSFIIKNLSFFLNYIWNQTNKMHRHVHMLEKDNQYRKKICNRIRIMIWETRTTGEEKIDQGMKSLLAGGYIVWQTDKTRDRRTKHVTNGQNRQVTVIPKEIFGPVRKLYSSKGPKSNIMFMEQKSWPPLVQEKEQRRHLLPRK